jgi:hypothetical protein
MKKQSTYMHFFESWTRGYFKADEFVLLYSAFGLFVCGSHCSHHVSCPTMMEDRMGRLFLQFPNVRHNLQNDLPFCSGVGQRGTSLAFSFFPVNNPKKNILTGCLANVQIL